MDYAERPILAIFLRVAAMALIATMFMLVKYVGERGVATPEIMFWRQAITIPLLLGWLAYRRQLYLLRTTRTASHAGRAATGMAAMGLNFFAAMLLSLAEATTLSFTTPIFAVILSVLLLREHVGRWRWSAVLLGFIGILIITRPGSGELPLLGLLAGLAGGLMVAIVSFQIRDLARTDPPIACVFWFAAFGALMTGLLLPTYMTSHDPIEWLLLLAIGVVGTLGQLLITLSLKYGSVATVIVMDYTSLIWATIYGWLIWDLWPDVFTWLGAPAVIAAGLIIAWREHRLSRAVPPPTAQELD